jgi:hypothetical protein
MIAEFDPTGTHIHKGFLKAKMGFYPEPTDKTYATHYVQVPVIPPGGYPGEVDEKGNPIDEVKFKKWLSRLPKVWQLNPCISPFIVVPETIRKDDLQSFIFNTFNGGVLATLDDCLIRPDSAHLIQPLMQDKSVLAKEPVKTADIADLIASVNVELGKMDDLSLGDGGSVVPIEPQSLDIGPGATDRASEEGFGGYTCVDLNNSSNGTGTFNVFEMWCVTTAGVNVKIGTFSGSGVTYTNRDYETVGAVPTGSKQTFSGLDCDGVTGDFAGYYGTAGTIERDSSGAGLPYKAGDQFGQGSQTYTAYADRTTSVYGTGAAAGISIPVAMHHYKMMRS